MWKIFGDFIVANYNRFQRNFRLTMAANFLAILFMGAGIGAICALWVLTMNDVLDSPWSYLCAIAIPFLAKTAIMWIGTLAVGPSISHLTSRIFENQTGIVVPEHQRPPVNFIGNVLTFPIAAGIAVAIYFSGLDANSSNAMGDEMIYYIAILVGAAVAVSENLSNPVVIKAIWHNRADYQETPLYKQSTESSVEKDKPNGPSANGHSHLTRAEKRRANRDRTAGKR